MDTDAFETRTGHSLTAVTAAEMREVDRVATEDVCLPLLSMMENAGRNLARVVSHRRDDRRVVVFAGAGGNGGGGLAAARHLTNRDVPVTVVLDRDPETLSGATATQHRVLEAMDVPVRIDGDAPDTVGDTVAVDALVGYGLTEALRGTAADLAARCNEADAVVSLDVPTGVNATTGEVPGPAVDADVTLTLALPKTGLGPNAGALLLGDIAIPAAVYDTVDVPYRNPFEDYVVPIRRTAED